MLLHYGVLVLLGLSLDWTSAQTTVQDCDVEFIYNGQNTNGAISVSLRVAATFAECQNFCISNTDCLSYNYNPTDSVARCWYQNDAGNAYVRRVFAGITNVERACRVPNLGCDYEFYTTTVPAGTGVDLVQGQLGLCYEACFNSPTCVGFTWDMGGPPRCIGYTNTADIDGATFDASSTLHMYKLVCRFPTTAAPPTTVPPTTAAPVPTTVTPAPVIPECGYRRVANTNARGGIDYGNGLTTYEECDQACVVEPSCFGFDYDRRPRAGLRCFLLNAGNYLDQNDLMGVDHYEEVCPCPPSTAAPTVVTTADPAFPTMPPGAGGLPGPTSLPAGWVAYPNNQIPGGLLVSDGPLGEGPPRQLTGDECTAECDMTADCTGYDYNINFAVCFIHIGGTGSLATNTICDPLTPSEQVYHTKKAACPAPYPAPAYP